MTDTVRTVEELLALCVVGAPGAINAQALRDLIATVVPGAILRADRQLTDTELRDLHNNPVLLVAAPGAGLCIDVIGVFTVKDFTTPYTVVNVPPLQVPLLGYTGDGGATYVESDFESAGVVEVRGVNTALEALSDLVPKENAGIELRNNGVGDITGGDPANTFSIRIYYRIEPYTPFGA